MIHYIFKRYCLNVFYKSIDQEHLRQKLENFHEDLKSVQKSDILRELAIKLISIKN